MKPQCNTSADCLRELARVMDQFGIDTPLKAVKSRYVNDGSGWIRDVLPAFNSPHRWQFAIAEVEGRPVFPDSKVYFRGEEWLIRKYENELSVLITREGAMVISCWVEISDLSLNPPKPETVMVELPVKIAEFHANFELQGWHQDELFETQAACKTALEKLK